MHWSRCVQKVRGQPQKVRGQPVGTAWWPGAFCLCFLPHGGWWLQYLLCLRHVSFILCRVCCWLQGGDRNVTLFFLPKMLCHPLHNSVSPSLRHISVLKGKLVLMLLVVCFVLFCFNKKPHQASPTCLHFCRFMICSQWKTSLATLRVRIWRRKTAKTVSSITVSTLMASCIPRHGILMKRTCMAS